MEHYPTAGIEYPRDFQEFGTGFKLKRLAKDMFFDFVGPRSVRLSTSWITLGNYMHFQMAAYNYFDEFMLRFNRRKLSLCGMLFCYSNTTRGHDRYHIVSWTC